MTREVYYLKIKENVHLTNITNLDIFTSAMEPQNT